MIALYACLLPYVYLRPTKAEHVCSKSNPSAKMNILGSYALTQPATGSCCLDFWYP